MEYNDPHVTPTSVQEMDRSWLVLLHLSGLLGYVVPLAGFIAPVVIWLIMKDESPEMDRHGRNVMNWVLTSTLYFIVAGLLCLILIGIPLVILMAVLAIVFPIIGAIKASQGIEWEYPLTIHFF